MKERPILFSAPMVRALLEGTKTQTRRVVARGNSVLDWDGGPLTKWPGLDFAGKIHPGFPRAFSAGALRSSEGAPQGVVSLSVFATGLPNYRPGEHTSHRVYPRWRVGDRLWVKETIRLLPEFEPESEHAVSEFSADGEITKADAWPWKRRVLPSIHMPRGLSRITLEITEVRVERLCRISDDDARAEGVEKTSQRGWRDYGLDLPNAQPHAPGSFASLWGSINGIGSWSANPWVWVLTFKRVTP